MITVSLINELQFIAASFSETVFTTLKIGAVIVNLEVSTNLAVIKFQSQEIWREKIATADSNFGVESCTTIYQIMSEILSGKTDWRSRYVCDFS